MFTRSLEDQSLYTLSHSPYFLKGRRSQERKESANHRLIDDPSLNTHHGALLMLLDGLGNRDGVPDVGDLDDVAKSNRFFMADSEGMAEKFLKDNPSFKSKYQTGIQNLLYENMDPHKDIFIKWLATQRLAEKENVTVLPQYTTLPHTQSDGLPSKLLTLTYVPQNIDPRKRPVVLLPGDGGSVFLYERAARALARENRVVVCLDYFFSPDSLVGKNHQYKGLALSGENYVSFQADSLNTILQSNPHLNGKTFDVRSHSAGFWTLLAWNKLYSKESKNTLGKVVSWADGWAFTGSNRFTSQISILRKKDAVYNTLPLPLVRVLAGTKINKADLLGLKLPLLGVRLPYWHLQQEMEWERGEGPLSALDDAAYLPDSYRFEWSSRDTFVDGFSSFERLLNLIASAERKNPLEFKFYIEKGHSLTQARQRLNKITLKNNFGQLIWTMDSLGQWHGVVKNDSLKTLANITLTDTSQYLGGHFFFLKDGKI